MRTLITLLTLSLSVSGCAHQFMRGTVAKKIESNEAIICLGNDEVKIGDEVKFEKSVCNSTPSSNITMHENVGVGSYTDHTGQGYSSCELIYLGEGKVVKLVNDHFSIVKTDSTFEFSESTQVELIKK